MYFFFQHSFLILSLSEYSHFVAVVHHPKRSRTCPEAAHMQLQCPTLQSLGLPHYDHANAWSKSSNIWSALSGCSPEVLIHNHQVIAQADELSYLELEGEQLDSSEQQRARDSTEPATKCLMPYDALCIKSGFAYVQQRYKPFCKKTAETLPSQKNPKNQGAMMIWISDYSDYQI